MEGGGGVGDCAAGSNILRDPCQFCYSFSSRAVNPAHDGEGMVHTSFFVSMAGKELSKSFRSSCAPPDG